MKIRRQLRFLHRWIGLLAAVWILQLAMTGLLLQQADNLSLHQRFVQSPWLLQWFGYGQKAQSFQHHGQIIYQVDDQLLINNQRQRIPQTIHFAARMNDLWVVATKQTIYAFNNDSELMWRLDDFDGLPTPIDNLHVDGRLWIEHNNQWSQINGQLLIQPSAAPKTRINHAQQKQLSNDERRLVLPKTHPKVLSFDKVLADIHAGYKGSVWLNTVSALALLYLSLSGIFLFFKTKRKEQKTRH